MWTDSHVGRMPGDARGRDGRDAVLSQQTSRIGGGCQKQGRGKEGLHLIGFRGSPAMLTAWSGAVRPPEPGRMYFCCSELPVCGNLWQQPKEANTGCTRQSPHLRSSTCPPVCSRLEGLPPDAQGPDIARIFFTLSKTKPILTNTELSGISPFLHDDTQISEADWMSSASSVGNPGFNLSKS